MAKKMIDESNRIEAISYVNAKIRSHVEVIELESNTLECWLVLDARVFRNWLRDSDLNRVNKLLEVRDNALHLRKVCFEKTSSLDIKSLVNCGRLEYVTHRDCNWSEGEEKRASAKPDGKRNGNKRGHRSDYSFVNGEGRRVRVEVKHRGAWFFNQENK